MKRSPCAAHVLPNLIKRKKLFSTRAAYQNHDYHTLKNQPESLNYEAISLISIDYSADKLTRNGESNNLYLHT